MGHEMLIRNDDDARQSLHAAVKDAGISLTRLCTQTGLSVGSITRYANNVDRDSRAPGGQRMSNNIWLSTFLRALDGVGYEVVVRPKVTGSRRERRLAALRERNNARDGEPKPLRPDQS